MRYKIDKRMMAMAGILWFFQASANAAIIGNWTLPSPSSASWNATGVGTGWDPAVPNGMGDTAQIITAISGTLVNSTKLLQNTGAPVTVGSIVYGNSNNLNNVYWEIAATDTINLNEDGVGSGVATIRNASTTVGNVNQIYFPSGILNLQDNLQVVNASSSIATGGAIFFGATITGAGNITFNSSQAINLAGYTNSNIAGGIRLTVANTFSGSSTIEKGTVAATNGGAFGIGNTINLGLADSNSAALLSQGATTIPNDIVIPTGNTGTLYLGALLTTGASAYSGTVTMGSNLTLAGRGNSLTNITTISGQITGAGNLTKSETGFVSLSNVNNDYSGNTVISGGTLVATGGSAIPNGAGKGNVSLASGTFFALAGDETINGLVGSAGTVRPSVNNGTSRTLSVGDNNYTGSFGGVLANQGTALLSVTKVGGGTLTLTGVHTYTGATSVSNGTLLVNGNNIVTSAYTVNSGATLGGTGSLGIASAVSVTGTLAPGANNTESLVSGGLTFNALSTFAYELDTSVLNGDLMVANGALNIDSTTTLALSEVAAGTLTVGDKLTLINYSGAWNGNSFAGFADNSTFTFGSNSFAINYNDTTGASNFSAQQTLANFVTLTVVAVPEPSTFMLAGIGLVGLALLRKSRMK